MWSEIILSLAAAVPNLEVGLVADGMAFGPRQTLICEWFSNFENSRFERCRAEGRNLLPRDGASLKCVAQTCEQLDAEARRVARWGGPEAPWGTFSVRLVGRVSIGQHAKGYLGDGTKTVLVEQILSVSKLN